MIPVNVAAVSYLNTVPLLHGLKQSAAARDIRLSLMPPSACAAALEAGEVALSLTPVAAIPHLPAHYFVSDYCIGATGAVRTVVLLSNTPLDALKTVYLDPHSRTSVQLVQVLAARYWKIKPVFAPLTDAVLPLKSGEGCVMIGDKVFSHEQQHAYRYDLAEAWVAFTGKPFVFAAWISTQKLDNGFLQSFNEALQYGVTHIREAIAAEAAGFDAALATDYLMHNIHYLFDENKKEGLHLFLNLL